LGRKTFNWIFGW